MYLLAAFAANSQAGETLSPGRCITLTSDSVNRKTSTTASAKVFLGGVERAKKAL